jgi:peptide/nickel transport system permease protein
MNLILVFSKRFASACLILVIVTGITFSLLQLAPGDPARAAAGGEGASPEAIEAARERLGLDKPIPIQYLGWLGRLLQGDLGDSFVSGQPIWDLVNTRVSITLALAIGGIVVALMFALPVGFVAALHKGRQIDKLVLRLSNVGLALPELIMGSLLILIFSFKIALFPATGYTPISEGALEWARGLVLPCVSLGIVAGAVLTRHVRSSMLETLSRDYVRTARSKQLPFRVINLQHVLRNASVPILTTAGVQLLRLLGGTVVVEAMFNIPGLGLLLVRSVFSRDLPVILAVATLATIFAIVVNLIVDLLNVAMTPRLRS